MSRPKIALAFILVLASLIFISCTSNSGSNVDSDKKPDQTIEYKIVQKDIFGKEGFILASEGGSLNSVIKLSLTNLKGDDFELISTQETVSDAGIPLNFYLDNDRNKPVSFFDIECVKASNGKEVKLVIVIPGCDPEKREITLNTDESVRIKFNGELKDTLSQQAQKQNELSAKEKRYQESLEFSRPMNNQLPSERATPEDYKHPEQVSNNPQLPIAGPGEYMPRHYDQVDAGHDAKVEIVLDNMLNTSNSAQIWQWGNDSVNEVQINGQNYRLTHESKTIPLNAKRGDILEIKGISNGDIEGKNITFAISIPGCLPHNVLMSIKPGQTGTVIFQ